MFIYIYIYNFTRCAVDAVLILLLLLLCCLPLGENKINVCSRYFFRCTPNTGVNEIVYYISFRFDFESVYQHQRWDEYSVLLEKWVTFSWKIIVRLKNCSKRNYLKKKTLIFETNKNIWPICFGNNMLH